MPTGARPLGQFDYVNTPATTDEVIGRRPGAKGIRFSFQALVNAVGAILNATPVHSVFGQTGTVSRLYLLAPDGTRHEVVAVLSPYTTPEGAPIYELGIDQNHTPEA